MKAISHLVAALALATSGAALAQDAAAPAAAPAAPVFKHNCVKAEWPGRVATQSATKRFDTEHKAYSDCIRAFVAEQSKSNQESVAKANAHVTAGNAAIAEFNEYIKDLNRQTGKEEPKKDEKK
jgi:hypothetical protein